jgi:hypothetical protein
VKKNRASRVISAWISDPKYCDEDDNANVLSIQGKGGTFEQLVNQYSGDMPFRAMMKELLRTGSIETRGDDKVVLVRAAYIPSDDENGMYNLLGEDVSLLISTIKHNITDKNNKPRYQRKVSYDKIAVEDLDEFRTMVATENQILLVKLNEWLAQHDLNNQTITDSKNSMKVGVGAYYFETESENPKELNDEN